VADEPEVAEIADGSAPVIEETTADATETSEA
jgi:hypothetical protein